MSDEEADLDQSIIDDLFDLGDNEFVAELVSLSHLDMIRCLGEIDLALDAGDRTTIQGLAHTITGISGCMGATRVGETARSLEGLARGGSLDGAPALRAEIARRWQRAQQGYSQQTPRPTG